MFFRGIVPTLAISIIAISLALIIDKLRAENLPPQKKPRYLDRIFSLYLAPITLGLAWLNTPLLEKYFFNFFISIMTSIFIWILLGFFCILLNDNDIAELTKPTLINLFSIVWLVLTLFILLNCFVANDLELQSYANFAIIASIVFTVVLFIPLIFLVMKRKDKISKSNLNEEKR